MLARVLVERVDVRGARLEGAVRVLDRVRELDGDDVVNGNVRGVPAAIVDATVEPPLLAVRARRASNGLYRGGRV